MIERAESSFTQDITITVHQTVFAQNGPAEPLEPVGAAFQHNLSQWTVITDYNLASVLVLLAVRADGLSHPTAHVDPHNLSISPTLPQTGDASSAATQPPGTAKQQLRHTHALLMQSQAFVDDSEHVRDVYYGCLIPKSEQSCLDLMCFCLRRQQPCSNARHVRVVVKGVHCTEYVEDRAHHFDVYRKREVGFFDPLKHLQGSAIPLFHGEWRDGEESV